MSAIRDITVATNTRHTRVVACLKFNLDENDWRLGRALTYRFAAALEAASYMRGPVARWAVTPDLHRCEVWVEVEDPGDVTDARSMVEGVARRVLTGSLDVAAIIEED